VLTWLVRPRADWQLFVQLLMGHWWARGILYGIKIQPTMAECGALDLLGNVVTCDAFHGAFVDKQKNQLFFDVKKSTMRYLLNLSSPPPLNIPTKWLEKGTKKTLRQCLKIVQALSDLLMNQPSRSGDKTSAMQRTCL
jgi:hypothetical protein